MGMLAKASILSVSTLLAGISSGCVQHHEAKVQTALLPPPSAAPVQHTGRLWVELGDATWQKQCRAPSGQRLLCFGGVRDAAFGALERSLWPSFPDVALRDGEALRSGDYLLQLDITIDAMAPGADGPGWSAVAAGGFRLLRDGKVIHEERLGSRSRPAFAYGAALGLGAGQVVDAFAAHVAGVLGAIAEDRPLQPSPLPAVVAEVLTPSSAPTPAASTPELPATPELSATELPATPELPATSAPSAEPAAIEVPIATN